MNDELPPRPPRAFAHLFQSFAGPLVQATTTSVISSVYPNTVRSLERFAHLFQSFAKPLVQPPAPSLPVLTVYPSILPGPPRLAHTYQSWAGPSAFTPATLGFPGYGTAGAATFALTLEGAKVTYSWGTDIFKSYSGAEQRCNTTGPMPRRRFEGNAFLLDGADRDVRGALQRAAAAGSTFLLALPDEELQLTSDAAMTVGAALPVSTTARSDWAIVTQRVILIGRDGSTATAVIQAVTGTTITVDTAPGTTGKAGAKIQPLIQILLDSQQGFSRYPGNAGLWAIRATANVFGWVGADSMGRGAQIVTYAGGLVNASALTDADLLIWDRPSAVVDTANESLLSLAEMVDMGALPFGIGGATVPDWARPIKYSSTLSADAQWLKAFLRQIRGRQKAFLLPTGRADLTYVSTTGGGIKIASAATGALDYMLWWVSPAHRRLAVTKADGSVQYVTVAVAPVDNHDGTLSLTLDASVTGTVARISLAELVRLDNNDSDDIAVTWDGAMFSVDLLARVVQA